MHPTILSLVVSAASEVTLAAAPPQPIVQKNWRHALTPWSSPDGVGAKGGLGHDIIQSKFERFPIGAQRADRCAKLPRDASPAAERAGCPCGSGVQSSQLVPA